MRKEIFLDLETNNSLDPVTGKLREIGIIYRVNGRIKKEFLIKSNFYNTLLKFLDSIVNKYDKNDKIYFIAYNAKFDSDFIRQLFIQNRNNYYGSYFFNPVIDVMQIAAFKLMNKKKPENFKLSTVCKHFGLRVNESRLHNALYDITLTKDLYNILRRLK